MSRHFVIVVRRLGSLARGKLGGGCLFLRPRQLVSLPRPSETQPRGPGLILLHHITILINVTDYALGERVWATVVSQTAKVFTGAQV